MRQMLLDLPCELVASRHVQIGEAGEVLKRLIGDRVLVTADHAQGLRGDKANKETTCKRARTNGIGLI